MRAAALLIFLLVVLPSIAQDRVLLRVSRSAITFTSNAPMEVIKATNNKALGVLDRDARSFAVQVPMGAFEGFNAPLQMEHFNENYLDSHKWPNAVFQGRIIEAVDLTVPGRYAVRAKGTLVVKGVERERIIPCELVVSDEGVRVTSAFDVVLDEHGIRIPMVVQQKLAAVVQLNVDLLFKPGQPSR